MFKEIYELRDLLDKENLDYTFMKIDDNFHLYYPNVEHFVCSVIQSPYSYGGDEDKLEIMGLLTKKEKKEDSVVGHLTAKDVFLRIKHYDFIEKKIRERKPKIIAAKLFNDGWYILYLHIPNVNDRISTSYFYYYDKSGEKIPLSMIEKYIILEEK